MTIKTSDDNVTDISMACALLDKLILKQLHLMEDKMHCELNIETSINTGSLQLAKSRYIMGQNTVSATRLPFQDSPEFSASTVCETTESNGVPDLKVVKNDSDNTVNPLHWFGVLVPQNLHKAQSIFQSALNYIVECVNIQLEMNCNLKNIEMLRNFKNVNGNKELK